MYASRPSTTTQALSAITSGCCFRANNTHPRPAAPARVESASEHPGRVRGFGGHSEFRRDRLDERKVPPTLTQEPRISFPQGPNTADQLRSSVACAGFVSCIRLLGLLVIPPR